MPTIDPYGPRLVVTGVESHGKSAFVYDGAAPIRQLTPLATMVPMWQVDEIPSRKLAECSSYNLQGFMPPPNGFRVFLAQVTPESELGEGAEFKSKFEATMGHLQQVELGSGPGFHKTETIELITMVAGEMYAISETGETLLRTGDTLIQRGTMHAWSNRSGATSIMLVVCWPAIA
jgi:hypothetical protein